MVAVRAGAEGPLPVRPVMPLQETLLCDQHECPMGTEENPAYRQRGPGALLIHQGFRGQSPGSLLWHDGRVALDSAADEGNIRPEFELFRAAGAEPLAGIAGARPFAGVTRDAGA